MKGVFVINKYYRDSGIDYVASRMVEELGRLGLRPDVAECPTLIIGEKSTLDLGGGFDFAIFWDKNVQAARMLERSGTRVFNSSAAIETCDDKAKTYLALLGHGVNVPKTVLAPLVYDVTTEMDPEFISLVERTLGYPVIVKENTGSQGRQVYLAETHGELLAMHASLLHKPHMFQQYVADERGVDIRVYVVGGKAVASCKRRNTVGFKANVFSGGKAEHYDAPEPLLCEAEKIAGVLGLDYGSVDFLTAETHVFVEANSNAYFRAIEQLGYNIAGAYAAHIARVLEG